MQSNNCAVVTGAARGIGSAIALELAKNGMNIVINYTSESSKENAILLQKQIETLGQNAIIIKADVSNFIEAKMLIEGAKESFGGVHTLVNNAGITRDNLIMRMSESDFDEVLNINLKGAFNCAKHVSSLMVRAKQGRIINISSVAGVIGNAGQANYSASKAGLIGLTKALSRELASRNITVNAVAPGFVTSEMTEKLSEEIVSKMIATIPLKRAGEKEEIAKLVAYLASQDASYITGQVISIDGGLAI